MGIRCLSPRLSNVLCRPVDEPSDSNIVLPPAKRDDAVVLRAEVIAVGPDVENDVSVADIIFFTRLAGEPVQDGGEELYFVPDVRILAAEVYE